MDGMYVIRKIEHTKKGGKHENRDNIERDTIRRTDIHYNNYQE